ncbi:MAG TPA: hypothetical protein VKT73_10735 [Xanthobacteraceae bacterium]|nr:hypothetical protein [Xanthobacteraceae bacterium]
MSIAAILLFALALYVAAGIVIGILFVLFGVTQALAHPIPVSIGARILILPGSIILWPLVLGRWLQARSRR